MTGGASDFKRERFIWGIRYLERVMIAIGVLYPVMRFLGFFSLRTGLIWLAVGVVLFPLNLWGRRLYRTSSEFERWAMVGTFINIIFLTILVYSTALLESPFLPIYGVMAVGSSVHLDFRSSLVAIIVSVALLANLGYLEMRSLIPHVALFADGSDPRLYLRPGYVAFVPAAVFAFSVLVAYGSGYLSSWLREREAELERQAQEHWVQLGHFSAVVAHEVKNPLATMKGAAGIVEKDETPPDTRKRMARTIRDEVDRLGNLVSQYLDFARPRSMMPLPLQLNDFVRRVVGPSAESSADSNIKLECDLMEGLPPVAADAEQLHQVLLNLMQNARQAMSLGGTIKIITRRDAPGWLELAVEDSGPGISADVLPKVFQPFFTTKARGSGLGLPVVKQIIEAHKGSIVAANRPEGGAIFTIRLPEARA